VPGRPCAWRIAESEHFNQFARLVGLAVRDLAILFIHLLATLARFAGPGGARSVVAESVLVKQQLLILNRSRKRSPKLRLFDRVVVGLYALLMRPARLIRSAIVLKPSTLLGLHRALTTRKYRRLFSSKMRKKPGPKGPSQDVIAAVVEMKRRNPTWGCPRIAQQIALAFHVSINKDVVRRILTGRNQPMPESAGPSWLTLLGHAKDSLWSLDLFRCESAALRTHWVLGVMDHCTRRIVGFGVQRGVVDGMALCRMFNRATRGQTPPRYLSADHDPLYRFYQWQANLRILDVTEIKTVPYVPLSHPFVERLIGTIRRECRDRTLFWTAADLETKLLDFQRFYNGHRAHAGLDGRTPKRDTVLGGGHATVSSYRWQPHCRGLYQTPMAA
jgi:putative transposase